MFLEMKRTFSLYASMPFLVSVVHLKKNYLDKNNKGFSWTSYWAVKQIFSKLNLKAKHAPLKIQGNELYNSYSVITPRIFIGNFQTSPILLPLFFGRLLSHCRKLEYRYKITQSKSQIIMLFDQFQVTNKGCVFQE